MITLKSPQPNALVSLQTEEHRAFLEDEPRRARMDGGKTFCYYDLKREGVDASFPAPILFSWEGGEAKEGEGALYTLLISEREDMQGALFYMTPRQEQEVYNLKVGTRYFWCVQQNGKRSEILAFDTALILPRALKIENISNVRDLGGYLVAGGRVRQGLVFRGGEFELHGHLTAAGAEALLRLGIRTELDMRGEAIGKVDFTTAETLGISRRLVPSVPYSEIFKEENRASVAEFFKTFTQRESYPIYFHCWGGADRTGTFAFVLGAFLGMPLSALIDDYEFTSLAVWGTRTRNYGLFQEFLERFLTLSGDTLFQKADTFLKEYGALTEEERRTLYEILVEPFS